MISGFYQFKIKLFSQPKLNQYYLIKNGICTAFWQTGGPLDWQISRSADQGISRSVDQQIRGSGDW